MDEQLVGEDAPDCKEIEDGCHEGQDSGKFEDDAFLSCEVPGGQPDLESQKQQAGDDGYANLQPSVLEQCQSQEVSQGDGNHQAQEIDIVSEIDGFQSTSVTDGDSKGTEEKGRYYAAGQGKI